MSDRIFNQRRQFLPRHWLGAPLNYLLRQENSPAFRDAGKRLNPLSPKPGHHAASAKAVIWLFMEGGPSHLDLFDPKPTLEKLAGQPMHLLWSSHHGYGHGANASCLATDVHSMARAAPGFLTGIRRLRA
jgi:hypothetical protein